MNQTIGLVMALLAVGFSANAGLVDAVSTPVGLTASGQWRTDGFQVAWDISPNGDRTWRYRYEFTKPAGAALKKDVSYVIIQVSDTLTAQDISGGWVPGGYDAGSPSTPGLPGTIWGVKIELDDHNSFSFDSTRAPMWGDVYAKGGTSQSGTVWNAVYNSDFGVWVSNANDYDQTPVDAWQRPLYKVLVPDTIPEPPTMIILALGAVLLRKRK
ncbi:MAG: hypothetical protein ACO21J_09755 [Anaerohalosphaeraceae bacterium]